MKKEIITPRERVQLAIQHKETDRVPIAMVCSGINTPAYIELDKYLINNRHINAENYLKEFIDIKNVFPRYKGNILASDEDFWGVKRKSVSFGGGEYNEIYYRPLANAKTIIDVLSHKWPTTDWFDYSGISENIKNINVEKNYCIMASGGNIFETSWFMRGFEQTFMDVIMDPELINVIFKKVTEFYIENVKKILEAGNGKIDLFFTADDIGGQSGLLMSKAMWEENIKPYHIKLNKTIHEYGVKIIYHSDGAIMEIVDGFIDMGIDVLQALQFDANGMDPNVLKNNYGDKLSFEGGISVQSTLPFKKKEDVIQEVRERIRILGKSGGYILGPSHNIQVGTPPENITAMFDTAVEYKI